MVSPAQSIIIKMVLASVLAGLEAPLGQDLGPGWLSLTSFTLPGPNSYGRNSHTLPVGLFSRSHMTGQAGRGGGLKCSSLLPHLTQACLPDSSTDY